MNTWQLGLALGAAAIVGGTQALAQPAKPAAATPTQCPEQIAAIAACFEDRDPNGGFIFAAMPKDWNGGLIVFAHGGPSLIPAVAGGSRSDLAKYAFGINQGFGWVASSYRRPGYGVRMAVSDTANAQRFFVENFGKPKRTILHGASYGGIVAAKFLETYGNDVTGAPAIDGAIMNSGLVAGTTIGYEFRVDLRAVYQYYCQNLPSPDEAQYPLWMGLAPGATLALADLEKRVDSCTGVSTPVAQRSEQQKKNLANIIGVVQVPENLLFRHMQSATVLFQGMVKDMTLGRNPFTNVGIRYRGSQDDERLNREIARFAADPSAATDIKWDGEPVGIVRIPTISTHSINDPQVAVEHQSVYRDRVVAAGNGDRLVQTYTDEPQHTGQSPREMTVMLDALMQWIDTGKKPNPQAIAAACPASKLDGPCRFQPDYEPKPYSSKFYTREVPAAGTPVAAR
jgi:hypothetical protein